MLGREGQECEENVLYVRYVFKNAIYVAKGLVFYFILWGISVVSVFFCLCTYYLSVSAPESGLHNQHLLHPVHGRGLL